MLQVMCNHVGTSMPPLLSHTFEELCWHARECRQPIVAILFNPIRQNKEREAMLRALQRVMAGCQNTKHWLYWGAETTSEDGQKVLELYGNGQADQVILLAPSTGLNPCFIERIEANNLDSTDFNPVKLHERVKVMIEGLILEREQLKKWQKERMEQEMVLKEVEKRDKEKQKEKDENQRQQEKQKEKEENQRQQEKQKEKEENQRQQEKQKEKEENQRQKKKRKADKVVEVEDAGESVMAKQIREARRARVRPPPDEGTKIILRINSEHTRRIGRLFDKNALFQEVYDWAGSMDCVPLHFTIQRRQTVVRHNDPLERHEILDLMEREGSQINSLLESQVSFRGNFPPIEVNEQALSDTVVDSPQIEEEVKTGEEGKQEKAEENETEKDQLQDPVEENEQRQESKEETREEEMDGTEQNKQGQEKEMEQGQEQMEETAEEVETIQKKRKKDKRTTAKRRKAKHAKF